MAPRPARTGRWGHTHFAYHWNPGFDVARQVRHGIFPVVECADGHAALSLPELHVWPGCPDTGEVIDFTAGLWPLACREAIDCVIALLREQGRQYP